MGTVSKQLKSIIVCGALVMQLLASGGNYVSAAEKKCDIPDAEGSSKEYIVVTKDAATEKVLEREAKTEDVVSDEHTDELADNNILVLDLSENQKDEVESIDGVREVEPNVKLSPDDVVPVDEKAATKEMQSNDPEDIDRWNMDAISAFNNSGYRGKGVKVAIMDSGISYSEDINVKGRANLTDNVSESEGEPLFDDFSGHGTSIASIIGANRNSSEIRGIADKADIYSIKVLENNGAPLSRIIEGIYLCIEEDMDIINMSFGTKFNSEALHKAVKDADRQGIIMVAASGNNGNKATIDYPAGYNEVIAVGASTGEGKVADFTSEPEKADVLAPGEKVWASSFLQGTMPIDGTSIASAHVSGAAAVIKEKNPSINGSKMKSLLKFTAKKGIDTDKGIINLAEGLKKANRTIKTDARPQNQMSRYDTHDTSDIVTGSWSSKNHQLSAEKSGISYGEITVIAETAHKVDKYYPVTASSASRMECKPVHGQHNYVANLHYIYFMARYAKLYNTYNFLTAAGINNFHNNLGSKRQHDRDKTCGSKDYEDIRNALRDILTGAAKDKNGKKLRDVVNKKNLSGNRLAAAIIMGFGVHLLGDVYAHRTMVPKEVARRTSGSNTIAFSKFTKGEILKKKIAAWVIETGDINGYGYKENNGNSRTIYEDNATSFYPSRYSFTKKTVYNMLKNFTSGSNQNGVKYDPNSIFATGKAKDFSLYVNNMYPYAQSAGYGNATRLKDISTAVYRADRLDGIVYYREKDINDYPYVTYK